MAKTKTKPPHKTMTATAFMYAKKGCPYCAKAEHLLSGISLQKVYPSKEQLKRFTRRQTYPQIYMKHPEMRKVIRIGGSDDLQDVMNSI